MDKSGFKNLSSFSFWQRLSFILLLSGIFLYFYQYLSNRSLWLDEAMLALNIIHRSWPQLLQPLDDNQAAPIGFLLVTKILISIFGEHEYIWRSVPFISGITAIILFWRISPQILNKPSILFALILYVFSFQLVRYASEFKPYALCLSDTS